MDNFAASAPDEFVPPAPQDMALGTLIDERYQIVAAIGEGSMGAVYLAEHVEVGQKVAIKVLNPEPSARASIARRFRAEACKAGSLGHPHIVEVFDAGALPDGRLFVVMEHLAGRNLAHELEEVLVFDAERACVLMRQVALALAAAHGAGIVHRALKPSSVMVAAQPGGEVVKLLDFGLAAKIALNAESGEHPSEAGAHSSPADYMAPEQATSVAPTPAIDVYAVGVMLYELLSGSLPFTARHAFELLNIKLLHPAPSIDARRPGLPPRLVRLIADCLSIDPAARPADGAALVPRFDAVLADLRRQTPLQAEDVAATIEPVRRRRRAWPVALAVGVVLAAGVAFVAWPRGATEPELAASAPVSPPPAPSPAQAEPPPVVVPPAEPAPVVAPPLPPEPAPRKSEAIGKPAARRPAQEPELAAPAAAVSTDEAHLTPRCQRIRTKASEARRAQRWSVLRDQSRHRECWASEAEARKLQTKAAMELADFAGCVAFGAELRDPEVQQWLKLCKLRAEE
ncbi:serine/threonine protein kinase [Nannocystis exedens]|uniref:Serine/threonine protein kinase n=1 Tax=Nannocystis exedens TaxID=54 RepID=A0A1I1WHW2_9BACT|nr:serine/threonine-protein kinase [Nannocystis exedens]PCC67730.1 Serine/threonine-protein kinase PrkC [Nannocystis exedens]SFD94652.1 serine/threonine protein kinase [Nannocystis exedens]